MLYQQDFDRWVHKTAQLLREGRFQELDLPNLLDEIEDMSRRERQALRSNLIIVLMHLLKYQYQPEKRSRSWRLTLFEHRMRIQESLKDSPSLKPYLNEVLADCYTQAKKMAEIETDLDCFPEECPYLVQEVLDQDFLPN